ncbi:MAG: FtsH protease activity modulator HflK [Fimbriimonadaceae bacterium]|nr:FtsH protease activity modulator HflK [Fimbriimonadaceae bacterium]
MSPASWLATWRMLPAGRRGGYLGLLWLLTGFYVVGPDQVAVVRLCGRPAQPVTAGVWWRLPWPLSRVDRLRLAQPRLVSIGGSPALNLVGQETGESAEHLTADQNLVRVRAAVQYTISDPVAYLFEAREVDRLVAAAVQAELTATIASTGVDPLMTSGQQEVSRRTLTAAQARLEQLGLGVTLLNLSGAANLLQAVKPPPDVQQAFDDVAGARQDYQRKINDATGYSNELLPQARGEAAELRSRAAGYRTRVINEAQGRAARFSKLLAAERAAPGVTRARLQLETWEQLGPRLKTTVVQGGGRPIDLGLLHTPPAAPTPGGTP